MDIVRGDVYYIYKSRDYGAQGNEMYAARPGVIVSNNTLNREGEVYEVVYLTTQPKQDRPEHVEIKSQRRHSIALCEQVTTVTSERVGTYFGTLSASEMRGIDRALGVSLGIPQVKDEKPVVGASEALTEDAKMTQLRTERDLYKKMYEDLLGRVMR